MISNVNFFGGKLNGISCRKLMKHHVDIIDSIRDVFIEMSKCIVSDEYISLTTNKHKTFLKEIDKAYRCVRSLNVNDDVKYINSY